MPRSLSLLALLALPFIVRSPDEPTGGALDGSPAFDAEIDFDAAREAAMDQGPSVFDDEPSMPFPGSEEEGENGDADPDKGSEDAPALPEKIEVDGTDVPMADLLEAYKGREGVAAIKENADTYGSMIDSFFAGPQGAQEVLRVMLEKGRETYGDEFAAQVLGVPASLPEDFDPESATPNERALVTQNAALQRKIGEMQTQFQRTLDDLKPVVDDRRLAQAGDAYAATVNATIPGANVDAKTIAAMMKEHGSDDPVKAYKLATYDTKAVDTARQGKEAPKDTMPRQGAQKTYDPMDKTLTVDKIASLLKQGYVPQKA